ncbi:two-component sensor histidine kinase [Brumimicrobium glaciale]|jgi:K+-sensing histidine kinase KdpD|uniref:histidine kinase n=1 Tax=Brumimicrobium glaciale TaxID=200475 RepID=A0A4V1WGA8_9FLAO|nr:ATP-binding protein [Brumimicrobium glaciale]RYM36051.1 two-component sensor histidine kinase [Brumimicrobium glaciale]
MKKQTAIFFYILGVYVVMQFVWWGYHIIDLSSEINSGDSANKRMFMIIGEGLVFFLILMLGLWKIRNSIQKEMKLSSRQNNFLLSVTHELKTPLTSNKLYLQTLLKRKNLDRDQQEDMLKQAIIENKRLEEMIENILTATRIENHRLQLNIEEYNLSEQMTQMVEKWSKTRIPVQISIEEHIITKVDLFVIETVLHNLLENALKYAGQDAKIEVYLFRKKNTITWGVKDDGNGIPQEHIGDVFSKFVRIGNEETRAQKGTGLGLYIVKNLLKFHCDTIVYLPNKPKGAHFKITRNERK